MQVPRFVPPESPWSPVGYRVVEVAGEQEPGCILAVEAKGPAPVPLPSSPVGYRVVLVAEDQAQPAPRARTTERPAKRSSRRRGDPAMFWVPVAAVIFFIVLVFGALAMMNNRTRAQQIELAIQPVLPPNIAEAPQVVLPEPAQPAALFNLPEKPAPENKDLVAEAEKPAAKVLIKAAAPPGVPDCETFGTAVGFVRNPAEAARLARAQNKLTFLLHVSGNFEEARFT